MTLSILKGFADISLKSVGIIVLCLDADYLHQSHRCIVNNIAEFALQISAIMVHRVTYIHGSVKKVLKFTTWMYR